MYKKRYNNPKEWPLRGLALMIIVLREMIHSGRKGTATFLYFQIFLKKNKIKGVPCRNTLKMGVNALCYFSSSAAASAALSAMTFSM